MSLLIFFRNQSNLISFAEKSNTDIMTLKPKKERRPRLKEKSFDTGRKRKKERSLYDTRLKDQRTYDTRLQDKFDVIGRSLGWKIRAIHDEKLANTLHELAKSRLHITEPIPVFRKMIYIIEKEKSRKMDVKQFFISASIKYCYFGIRQTIPQLRAFERIVDGILTRDVKKIGAGLVESITGEYFATILMELVES